MNQNGVWGGILRNPMRPRMPSPVPALPHSSSRAPSPVLPPVLSFALLPALALAVILPAGCAATEGTAFFEGLRI